jgi:hypothetical protein
MLIWYLNGHKEFFRLKPEVSPPGLLDEPPPPRAPISV